MLSDENQCKMSHIITEKEVITQLLKQFKKTPCLWDSSDEHYHKKAYKDECLKKMVPIWKQIDQNATIDTIRKKLGHFRSGYRRELKKVESSLMCGATAETVHKPSLWYFDHLRFLSENKNPVKCSTDDEDDNSAVQAPCDRLPSPESEGVSEEENSVDMAEPEDEEPPHKKQCTAPSYLASYGETIARQLSELNDDVRYEVERIIADVIYKARTGTLHKYAEKVEENIYIPECGPSWYEQAAAEVPVEPFVTTLAAESTIKTEFD